MFTYTTRWSIEVPPVLDDDPEIFVSEVCLRPSFCKEGENYVCTHANPVVNDGVHEL